MRAQKQRRAIWLLNVGLGVALLGVVAWYVLAVRPAAAAPDHLRPPFAPDAVADVRSREVRDETALLPSVSEDALQQVDRPLFQRGGRRFHWAYSGPLPPPPPPAPTATRPTRPIEDDLEKLGRVRMVLYVPPDRAGEVASDTVVYWQFTSEAKVALSPGDWFEDPKSDEPKSIKLYDVRRHAPGSERYDLVYEVYASLDGDPVKQGAFTYDGRLRLAPPLQAVVQHVDVESEGSAPASTRPPIAPNADPGARGSIDPIRPNHADRGLQVSWDGNSAQVTFDPSRYDSLKDADLNELAKSVKVQEAVDDHGQVYGVVVSGLAADAPADNFILERGDVLISIDDRPVRSRSDAVNIAQGISADATCVKVVIERRGELLTYNVDPRDPRTRRDAANAANRMR